MRIDIVVRDVMESVKAIIRGLDNQITASENLAPEGRERQVLTSNGSNIPPSYKTPTIQQLSADPASPVLGEMWVRTDLNELRIKSLSGTKSIGLS